MSDELMTPAEAAGVSAILTHVAGILAALPMERYEATMEARARQIFTTVTGDDYTELVRAREDRLVDLRRAAGAARKLVDYAMLAQGHWREAVRLATVEAGTSEPIAFDAEGMPAEGGHLVTLPSGKQVFQLDEPEAPAVVQPGGQVLYPRFGRVVAGVPDGA